MSSGKSIGKPEANSPSLTLEEKVIDALRTVYDPEIPVNIYDLGLVYDIQATSEKVVIQMTLTCAGCPFAGSLPIDVESRIREIEGVKSVEVEVVWKPRWSPDRISEAGKLQLGML